MDADSGCVVLVSVIGCIHPVNMIVLQPGESNQPHGGPVQAAEPTSHPAAITPPGPRRRGPPAVVPALGRAGSAPRVRLRLP